MNSNIKDIYGLTPSQEGIYTQYFQNTDTKTYQLKSLYEISKKVDLSVFEQSVELLSFRHRTLKTAFTVLKSTGAIKQVILENRKPCFETIRKEEPFSPLLLDNILRENIKNFLDLQSDSLFRVSVIDFTDKRFMCVHSHHIILDGWCFPVIINDLQKYYEELSAGVSKEIISDEIQKEVSKETSYSQYVNWIRKQDKTEASEYWHGLLAECMPAHIFGKENKLGLKNDDVVTINSSLGEELTNCIDRLAKENRVSHNTVFECAFGIAIQKYSGSDDVVFDKIISGRNIPLKNIGSTVGTFINTVPVRIRNSENTALSDMLKEIQLQTVNANKYGVLPLTEVYKSSGIDSREIDALFVFENYFIGDASDIEKGPLSPGLISFEEQTEFNLTVAIMMDDSGYKVRISYVNGMYTEREISDFINGYIRILSSLADSSFIKDISVTDTKLIEKINTTSHTYAIPETSTLYSLFENTAEKNKDKVCIKTAERNLTFGELLGISKAVDTGIREITKGKKSVIAVIAERSAEMYAAVYGIIRGGNAYLPIDPDYPQDRIDYILKNSGAAAVAAQGKYTGKVKNISCINMTELMSGYKENGALPCSAEPDDTAYVIYTSGSTGTPKGAKVSHKSAVNRILWMHDKYPLGAEDVILQKTPYTFDVSVWEIFWWGMCGGCLAASKPGEHFLPGKILEEAEKNKVTHIHFVPSVFELFLNYMEEHREEAEKFSSVKYVFLSGETLTANLVQRFYRLFDYERVTLHNFYGPTECAVDVTYYDCTPADADPIPIGSPIYNTQIYITDKYLKPVPVGVTGELCIGGMNVGQGYLNNPDLTAEKFIDNPFGEGKLYRTGDNAYLREDGYIIFSGRCDSQIKLNGQRIETGEIESVISDIQGAESVAVTVRKKNNRDVLVAFYSGRKGMETLIKDTCREKLPRYMIPSFVVRLDSMPLNRNGKLDRNILSSIELNAYVTEAKKPVNDTERYLCDLFEKILGEKNIGRDSDFFEMGGTSYSMISLLSEDGLENVTAAEFMRNSTPSRLARIISSNKNEKYEYLEPLHISENAVRAIILLPFAGGGAEAYTHLVKAVTSKSDDFSVYFMRYLHSAEECEKASEEIASALINMEIMLYSHCVGSAVALQIISCLEKKNVSVSHYFAGASIPPAKPSHINIWNYVPDFVMKNILLKTGADFRTLSSEKLRLIFEKFRKDTDYANNAYFTLPQKIKAPVSVIISKSDMFTKNYAQAERLWEKHAETVEGIYFIDSLSHYFQKENSETLAAMLLKEK
ncbi:MAG: amino acid adenylation domain-containing protein [Clostridia bacterium]|nr:amino acid adenylation domain-containing protein [Clostridia bacterium]